MFKKLAGLHLLLDVRSDGEEIMLRFLAGMGGRGRMSLYREKIQ